jgi:hypothetical protein
MQSRSRLGRVVILVVEVWSMVVSPFVGRRVDVGSQRHSQKSIIDPRTTNCEGLIALRPERGTICNNVYSSSDLILGVGLV